MRRIKGVFRHKPLHSTPENALGHLRAAIVWLNWTGANPDLEF
jgi:hypothetical protein